MQTPPNSRGPADDAPRTPVKALIFAGWTAGRGMLLLGIFAAAFIVTSSAAAYLGSPVALRTLAAMALVLGLPLLLRSLLRRRARRRGRPLPQLGSWFFVGWNLVLVAILCCCLSSTAGHALARHGDWILGEADGWLPRRYRPAVRSIGGWVAALQTGAERPVRSKPGR